MKRMIQSLDGEQAFPASKAPRGHSKPLPLHINLDQPGRLRVGHLIALFAVSHSTLYTHIKAGLIPKPDGYDGSGEKPRPYWNTATVRAILEGN